MTEKRFQVFVSSTFTDLEHERQEVMHALLELDCMPSGMELFPAANETQWNLIKKVIDDCDYYILLIGGRYGTVGEEGLSYTEMEYRYALETKKPTIAFLHRKPGSITSDKTEQTENGRTKLADFRQHVEKRLCKHWESPQELGSVVSRSLIQLIKSDPAVGWVRANELADKDATLELLRLRRTVDELREEIAKSRTSAPKGAEDLAQGEDAHTFNYSFRARGPLDHRFQNWNAFFDATWNEIFAVIAPLMIHESDELSLKTAVDAFVENQATIFATTNTELAEHYIRDVAINSDDFQTLKIQFRALGLISRSEKTRSVKDSGTYWTLTPYGDEIMTRLRAIRRTDFKPARSSGI